MTKKEKEEREKLLVKLNKWLWDAENSTAERTTLETSSEDYAFYAGEQDSDEALQKLEDANRPATVYNEVKPKVDMLCGMAAQTKFMPEVLPVGVEDESLAELMNGAIHHYGRKVKKVDKEISCFEHTVKGGRSLLYYYIDKSNPFKPIIKCKRIRNDNFHVDPDSEEYELSDARFVAIDKWISEDDLKVYNPKLDLSALRAWDSGNERPSFFNEAADKYRLVEMWYRELVKAVWFINPMTQQPDQLSPADFKQYVKMLKEGIPIDEEGNIFQYADPIQTYETFMKKVKYCIFSGDNYIEGGDNPYIFCDGKEFPCILFGAYKNEDKNSWFGVITMMKDPQKSVNTMRRQLSHLLQTLPKGLLVHEVGAILNIDEYEERSSDPTYHLEVGLGKIDKVRFEKQPQISPIYESFDAIASQAMKDASGIQNEMMGVQTTSREPGISVRMRHQTGVAVIYSLFSNFAKSRIQSTKVLMGLIQQFVTDQELIRIEGPKGRQLVAINTQVNPESEGFNDISAGKFDLYVDETVETTSMRSATAQILTDFAQNNPGSIPPDVILDYADIPYTVKERVRAFWEEQQKMEREKADRDYELELMKLDLERMKIKQSKSVRKGE